MPPIYLRWAIAFDSISLVGHLLSWLIVLVSEIFLFHVSLLASHDSRWAVALFNFFFVCLVASHGLRWAMVVCLPSFGEAKVLI